MFIIWGWRAVRRVIGTGEFFCPRCQGDTPYRHLAPRQWFTVFFIPIIPLARLDSYVECTRCKGAFVEAVLMAPTAAVFEHQLGLANRAMVAHLASLAAPVDGDVEAAALRALSSAVGVPTDYDRQRLHADIRAFASADSGSQYLRPFAEQMTVQGREELIRRAIATVEEMPRRTEAMTAAVDGFATALSITPAHLAGIRAMVVRDSDATSLDGER